MIKKLVVITGASSGIGMELAKRFAARGYPLLLLARRLAPMTALGLPNALCRSVDVTDAAAVDEAIREAECFYGNTDLLINCAGIMLLGRADRQGFEEWSRMIDVDVKGILTGTHAVLGNMKKSNSGTIINISSIAGRKTFDNHAVYCGAKFAVHAISESIRKEVAASLVRVIVIAPGVVETDLLSHTTDEKIKASYQEWKKTISAGLDAARIADCVEFAYLMPQDVCVREIVIAKTQQAD